MFASLLTKTQTNNKEASPSVGLRSIISSKSKLYKLKNDKKIETEKNLSNKLETQEHSFEKSDDEEEFDYDFMRIKKQNILEPASGKRFLDKSESEDEPKMMKKKKVEIDKKVL